MAAVLSTADMTVKKDSEILVKVEEALADLIVVTYCTDDKKFQGVLLDSNKGNLPFGVYSLHPALTKKESTNIKDEKLHSVSQRFTYQEPQYATQSPSKKNGPKGKPQQRQKMTVRLRPRKVLCSNCKGICNENNESVNAKKRRFNDDDDRATASHEVEKKMLMTSTLIPKLSRLHPNEISSAIKGAKTKPDKTESCMISEKISKCDTVTHEVAFVSVTEDINMNCDKAEESNKDTAFNSIFTSAKTLKICFGEGEGTVVKIPPIGDYNEDSGVACDMAKQSESKAAKKALKKARKQAKKNVIIKSLPTARSPKHIGALSPRNSDNPPDPIEKKHKHKVKHKKKSKLQRQRDENTTKGIDDESINYFSNIKGRCLKQKLSISLRRLSSNSYEKCDDLDNSDEWESDAVPEFPESSSEGVGGNSLKVSPGDIVWGKVVGFPWWPGRVLSVMASSRAHVAWFASTTSSLMPCDSLSPFLEDYKIRFNKKKRGTYKEAVKLATIEAKMSESLIHDPLASPPPVANESPRPINVFS